eukprot:m.42664 g.42664  ORF g.42664 m.42664 type:complete len:712 (+) comp7069_c0_seq2:122-2257(+)
MQMSTRVVSSSTTSTPKRGKRKEGSGKGLQEMSMTVHRMKCVQTQPQAINCIAFQSLLLEQNQHEDGDLGVQEKCAIARADATIEIWNITAGYVLEQILPGGHGLSVECMVWLENTLITAGVYSNIFEWDLAAGTITAQHDSYGGPVFSMAINNAKDTVVIGCDDGSVRMYEFDVQTGLTFKRTIAKQGGRVLCLSWAPDDATLAVGDDQGGIRIVTGTGKVLHRLLLQDSSVEEKVCVWDVVFTSTNTLASASSRGQIQFWNALHGVETQTLSSHTGPILALATTRTGEILSTGVDAKVVMYKQAITNGSEWEPVQQRRELTRDCRAINVSPVSQQILYGGLDTTLCSFDAKEFASPNASHHIVSSLPQMNSVYLSNTSLLGVPMLCSFENTRINIWSIASKRDIQYELQINLKSVSNVTCVAISKCGKFLAASALDGVRVFKLIVKEENGKGTLEAEKIMGTEALSASRELSFTTSTQYLVSLACNGSLEMLNLETGEFTRTALPQKLASKTQTRCHLSISSNDEWAVMSLANTIIWFTLDTLKLHGVARTRSIITSLSTVPKTSGVLVVTANKQITMFDSEKCVASKWSKDAGSFVPKSWAKYKGIVQQLSFCEGSPSLAVCVTQSGILFVDISKSLSVSASSARANPEKRAKQHDQKIADVGKSLTIYKPLLFAQLLDKHSLVVVERSWLAIEAALPDPIARTKYGT